jgi:hypothetical protein
MSTCRQCKFSQSQFSAAGCREWSILLGLSGRLFFNYQPATLAKLQFTINRHFEYCLHEIFIFWLHNYPSYNHNHIKLVKFSRRGGGGGGWVTPAALRAVYSLVRFVLCLTLKSYFYYIYYNKWWKCESSFFADTCTRRVPIFVSAKQIYKLSQTCRDRTVPYP